jgi:hypothetical protein
MLGCGNRSLAVRALAAVLPLALLVAVPTAGPVAAQAPTAGTLQLDDGSFETVLGVVSGDQQTGYQSVQLNRFTPDQVMLPLTIDTISILFPTRDRSGNLTGLRSGQTFQVLVYTDPAGTGDPANAKLRLRQNVRLAPNNSRFQDIALSPPVTIQSGDVWIGYTNTITRTTHDPIFHGALDLSSSRGRSWIFFDDDGGDFSEDDLSTAPVKSTVDALGFGGNWLIRASGRRALVVSGITPDFAPSFSVDACPEVHVEIKGVGFDHNITAAYLTTNPDGTGTRIDLTHVENVDAETVTASVPLAELGTDLSSEDPYYVFVESGDGLVSSGHGPGAHPLDLEITFARFSDSCLIWDAPDPNDPGGVPREFRSVISPCFGPDSGGHHARGGPLPTDIIAYKVYYSDRPGVSPLQSNAYKAFPAGARIHGFPRNFTGSAKPLFFIVTACRADGSESPPSNEFGLMPPGGVSLRKVTPSKIVAAGSQFIGTKVYFDEIPFTTDAVVKRNGRKVVQRGSLANGQTIAEYLTPGRSVVIKLQNTDGSVTHVPLTVGGGL